MPTKRGGSLASSSAASGVSVAGEVEKHTPRKKAIKHGGSVAPDAVHADASAEKKPAQIFQEATQMMANYVNVNSCAGQLRKNIKEDVAWAWAAAPAATEAFDMALEAVEIAARDEFAKKVHTHELGGVKKAMELHAFLKAATCYVDNFKHAVSTLAAESSRLTRMHLARSS